MRFKLFLMVLVVIASGCTDIAGQFGEEKEAELLASADDSKITSDSPGRITLNARNLNENSTFFYAVVRPVGDYKKVVRVTDMDDNIKSGFGLGDAPKEATTGQTFARVHKKMNISSKAKMRVELYRRDGDKVLDSKMIDMKVVEEEPEDD